MNALSSCRVDLFTALKCICRDITTQQGRPTFRLTPLFALAFTIFAGCAGTPSTPRQPQVIPSAWAQKPEERGTLPVGRIVAIEPRREQVATFHSKKSEQLDNAETDYFGRYLGFADDDFLSFGEFLVLPFVPILLFTGDFIMLFSADERPNEDAGADPLDEKISFADESPNKGSGPDPVAEKTSYAHESSNKSSQPDPLEEKIRYGDRMVYRHVIRLVETHENIVRDEFFTYKVGDCVALRSKPELLVPAIPDQC